MNTYFKKILVLGMFIPSFALAQMSTTVTDTITDQIDCVNITHNLKLGSKDANTSGDVTTLQVYLSQANFLDSDPTGYLGRATKKAVQDFQKANDITPTGSVGPYTRAKIKELSCKNTSSNTDTTTNTHVSDGTRVKTQTPPVVTPNTTTSGTGETTGTQSSTGQQQTIAKVDLKINGSDDPINLDGAREVKLSWMTNGVNDCQIMVAGVASTNVPTSGAQATTINPDWTSYVSLTCKRGNNGETVSDYVKVLKQTSPTPQPAATETKTPPVTPTNTTSTALAVKVISPNGGETYVINDDMKVYWLVTNMPTGAYFVSKLIGEGKEIILGSSYQEIGTDKTGTDHFNLSTSVSVTPGKYKVRVNLVGSNGEFLATDSSDDFIKITPATQASPTTLQ